MRPARAVLPILALLCGAAPALAFAQATLDPFGVSLLEVSLEVRSGEIVGIAGVSGNGQKELLAALSGETLSANAAVELQSQAVGRLDPSARRVLGLSFVPEERLGRGAVPALDLADNALLTGSNSECDLEAKSPHLPCGTTVFAPTR